MATSNNPLSKSATRRFPPPCWSDEETVALIQVYRDKWYSLRRGNLRAPDWQDVADGVAARFPGNVPKTSIQCRHKMEKLRKRYRSEIQRIGNVPKGYKSSWVHFKLMDSMELGVSVNLNDVDSFNDDDDDDEIEERVNSRYSGSGFNKNGLLLVDDLPPIMNPRYGSRDKGCVNEVFGGEDVKDEIVAAIEKLGDRFVKMEKMKMEMAREVETMRMNAEMKQTEMILETHRKIWDMFVVKKESKKMKREL